MIKIVKGLSVVISGLLLSAPLSAQPQSDPYVAPADELAEAREIMAVMFPADTREQMMVDTIATVSSQLAPALMQNPVFAEPGIRAIMDEFLADLPAAMRPTIAEYLPQMIEATAIAYTREFTLPELKEISDFAQTDAGRRYFSKVQGLLNDPAVEAANREYFQKVAALQQEQTDAIRQKLQAFLEANPDVAERLKTQNSASSN